MIAYVLPTLDRPAELAATLAQLGSLPPHDAEVVVVDNASRAPAVVPPALSNGLPARVVRMNENLGAAGRNHGVRAVHESREWIVMLDDDSFPTSLGHVTALTHAAPDTAAVQAEVFLDTGDSGVARREDGGLPEVFVGCGVAIRRRAFLDAGGYDAGFGYYAEEYDLAAKFLAAGMNVTLDRRFTVIHRKVPGGRSMDTILSRLVRNNAWVVQRYAPDEVRRETLRRTVTRYGRIAHKERAMHGFNAGMGEIRRTLRAQVRTPLASKLWDRFTGRAAARRSLLKAYAQKPFSTAAVVDEGKNALEVHAALAEMGVSLTAIENADALVIGTLSPGPMLDSWDRRVADGRRLIAPWGELVEPAADGLIEIPEELRLELGLEPLRKSA